MSIGSPSKSPSRFCCDCGGSATSEPPANSSPACSWPGPSMRISCAARCLSWRQSDCILTSSADRHRSTSPNAAGHMCCGTAMSKPLANALTDLPATGSVLIQKLYCSVVQRSRKRAVASPVCTWSWANQPRLGLSYGLLPSIRSPPWRRNAPLLACGRWTWPSLEGTATPMSPLISPALRLRNTCSGVGALPCACSRSIMRSAASSATASLRR